jgi:hypothetical protein
MLDLVKKFFVTFAFLLRESARIGSGDYCVSISCPWLKLYIV